MAIPEVTFTTFENPAADLFVIRVHIGAPVGRFDRALSPEDIPRVYQLVVSRQEIAQAMDALPYIITRTLLSIPHPDREVVMAAMIGRGPEIERSLSLVSHTFSDASRAARRASAESFRYRFGDSEDIDIPEPLARPSGRLPTYTPRG